jgi:hypothetical protein
LDMQVEFKNSNNVLDAMLWQISFKENQQTIVIVNCFW